MADKKRESYIDMIKGTAIMAVVLLHVNYNFPGAYFSTYSLFGGLWHVAVFFVIGGWYLRDERLLDYKKFAWGKIKGLYIKAMWIYIPFVLLHNVFFRLNWLYEDVEYNNRLLLPFKDYYETMKHLLMQLFFTHREPFSGAMWFVDSLFLGLLGYCLITLILYNRYFIKIFNKTNIPYLRMLSCITIALFSCYFHKHGLDIPKISNTCSAMLLISVGHMLGQRKLEFNNPYVFTMSLIVVLHYNALGIGMALNSNKYPDIVTLVIAPISVIYVLAYIFKRFDRNIVGKTISYVGKESFWVMGLHMVGFHLFTSILESSGLIFEHHFTTPVIYNWGLLIGYFLFGVAVPLFIKILIVNLFRLVCKK